MAPAIATSFVSAILSAGMVLLLRHNSMSKWSLDQPNHRSLHVQPTPRIGGLAMLLAVAISLSVRRPDDLPLTALLMAAVLAMVSMLDDRAHLPVALRLAVHVSAATWMALSWLHSFPPFPPGHSATVLTELSFPLTALVIIAGICWMTNLFNFMDGADGMAGGMAFIGFGGYAIAATMVPETGLPIAALTSAVAGAALGFLCFNFPKARIFMGDAGSVPLGFLAATIGIQGSLMGLWPWWFGPLVFSPFIVDATVTLLKRVARQEKIWVAHREHYYQRLILSGWSHRKTVISYYFLMLGSTGSALAAQNSHLLHAIASAWVITYASLVVYLEWRFYKHKKDKKEETPGAK